MASSRIEALLQRVLEKVDGLEPGSFAKLEARRRAE